MGTGERKVRTQGIGIPSAERQVEMLKICSVQVEHFRALASLAEKIRRKKKDPRIRVLPKRKYP